VTLCDLDDWLKQLVCEKDLNNQSLKENLNLSLIKDKEELVLL
jgi:hypothetical protein